MFTNNIYKFVLRFFMGIIFFSDDTRIRTSEGQDYKRTVYLLDHKVTAAVVSTSTIFLCAITTGY